MKKKMMASPAPAGIVTTHDTRILTTTRRSIASMPRAMPTPSTAPTSVCVVEIGIPVPDAMTMVVADGMDDPLLKERGPYDLLIANILAGPLVELAPAFGKAVAPRGSLVLAGLLAGEQEQAVRRACRRAGFRLTARLQRGDWAILWLRRRYVR